LSPYRKKYLNFNTENAHFTLMPGSRTAEINTLWVPMQQISLRLKRKYRNADFTAVAVDADRQKQLKNAQIPGFECEYAVGSVSETARKADFAIVASGSATLQVAAAGCPMVIMYQSSKILWHLLGRWLLTTKYLSLVNILANRELVPEFMPYFGSIEPIIEAIEQLIGDRDKLVQLSNSLIELAEPLTRKKACREVAKAVWGMLGQKSQTC
jgi:lipid-A-disaccharide synthase